MILETLQFVSLTMSEDYSASAIDFEFEVSTPMINFLNVCSLEFNLLEEGIFI